MNKFGERLFKIIPDNDLAEFAKQIGVKYETVRVWCKNKNLPNGSQLIKINKKYNVDLHWLLVGKEFNGKNIIIEEYGELNQKYTALMEEHLGYVKENHQLKETFKDLIKIINKSRQNPPGGIERRYCYDEFDELFKECNIEAL